MKEFHAEEEERRIQDIYRKRDRQGKKGLYQWHNQDVLLNQYRLHSVFAGLCRRFHLEDLSQMKILDLGCGSGGWLRTLMAWGADPEKLHGIDILPDRIETAKKLSHLIDYQVTSGFSIPFINASMDMICAHTVFSSVLSPSAREKMAKEMMRCLQPAGHIMIYDYRISSPKNPDTTGIGKNEITRIFPGMQIHSRSLTLAPPISRRIAPVSPCIAHMAEAVFPFLRTHNIFIVQPGKMISS